MSPSHWLGNHVYISNGRIYWCGKPGRPAGGKLMTLLRYR